MKRKQREAIIRSDSADLEKSCSSTSREVIQKKSGIYFEGLEVDEMSIVNKRCKFVRRRSLTKTPKNNTGS